MVMAVIVNNDEGPSTHIPPLLIVDVVDTTDSYAFIFANNSTQKAGWTTTPTPKSAMAKQRIRIYEGVRIDGVFTKVKIIKKFKTQATRELQAVIIINKMVKLVSNLLRSPLLGPVELFMMQRYFLKLINAIAVFLALKHAAGARTSKESDILCSICLLSSTVWLLTIVIVELKFLS